MEQAITSLMFWLGKSFTNQWVVAWLPHLAVALGAVWYRYKVEDIRGRELPLVVEELLAAALGVSIAGWLLVLTAVNRALPQGTGHIPAVLLASLITMPVFLFVFAILFLGCVQIVKVTKGHSYGVRIVLHPFLGVSLLYLANVTFLTFDGLMHTVSK